MCARIGSGGKYEREQTKSAGCLLRSVRSNGSLVKVRLCVLGDTRAMDIESDFNRFIKFEISALVIGGLPLRTCDLKFTVQNQGG